jgi:hypothetical protein
MSSLMVLEGFGIPAVVALRLSDALGPVLAPSSG